MNDSPEVRADDGYFELHRAYIYTSEVKWGWSEWQKKAKFPALLNGHPALLNEHQNLCHKPVQTYHAFGDLVQKTLICVKKKMLFRKLGEELERGVAELRDSESCLSWL